MTKRSDPAQLEAIRADRTLLPQAIGEGVRWEWRRLRPAASNSSWCRIFSPTAALARDRFGAHVTVNPAERFPYEVFNALPTERHLPGPAIVFECVGAQATPANIAGGWIRLPVSAKSSAGRMLRMPSTWHAVRRARHASSSIRMGTRYDRYC